MARGPAITVVGFVEFGDGSPPISWESMCEEQRKELRSLFADHAIQGIQDHLAAHPEQVADFLKKSG